MSKWEKRIWFTTWSITIILFVAAAILYVDHRVYP